MKFTLKKVKGMVQPGSVWECTEQTYRPELVGTIRTIVTSGATVWTWRLGTTDEISRTEWFKASELLEANEQSFRFALTRRGKRIGTVALRLVPSSIIDALQ